MAPTIVLKGLSKKNSLAAGRLRRMQRGKDEYFTGSEIGVSHMLGKEPVRGRGEVSCASSGSIASSTSTLPISSGGHRDGSGHLELKERCCFRDNIPSHPKIPVSETQALHTRSRPIEPSNGG